MPQPGRPMVASDRCSAGGETLSRRAGDFPGHHLPSLPPANASGDPAVVDWIEHHRGWRPQADLGA
jgi:hypothetical protein